MVSRRCTGPRTGRRRAGRGAGAPDHPGMNRAVVVGTGRRHRDRTARCARRDVSRIDAAVVEHDAVRDAVIVPEHDLLAAERRRVGRESLRPVLPDNGDRWRTARRRRRGWRTTAAASESRREAREQHRTYPHLPLHRIVLSSTLWHVDSDASCARQIPATFDGYHGNRRVRPYHRRKRLTRA